MLLRTCIQHVGVAVGVVYCKSIIIAYHTISFLSLETNAHWISCTCYSYTTQWEINKFQTHTHTQKVFWSIIKSYSYWHSRCSESQWKRNDHLWLNLSWVSSVDIEYSRRQVKETCQNGKQRVLDLSHTANPSWKTKGWLHVVHNTRCRPAGHRPHLKALWAGYPVAYRTTG